MGAYQVGSFTKEKSKGIVMVFWFYIIPVGLVLAGLMILFYKRGTKP
jgi:hypothetical protein